MTDDWRVTVPYDGEGVIGELLEHVRAGAVEHDAAERLGDRVVISASGDLLFLYTATEEDARTAEGVVRDLLGRHDLVVKGETKLERWHPEEERWEDGARPAAQHGR